MSKRRYDYFVLYDMEDFPICLFESLEELLLHINYDSKSLLCEFYKHNNNIKIIINKRKYKLFRFED